MLGRVWKTTLGVALVAAGIAMLVLPGPGLVVLALGVAMILSQSEWGRGQLTRIRVWARDRFGSPKVRAVEKRLPEEICPPQETHELRSLAEAVRERQRRAAEEQGGRRRGRARR
ncbi:MAG: PGPGW domain-containing protein [Actinomycetes bacterium]